MYAKSLLLKPANGRGLPTLNCCTMNSVSGNARACAGPNPAVFTAALAARIAGLCSRASFSRSAKGVGCGLCCATAIPLKNAQVRSVFRIFPPVHVEPMAHEGTHVPHTLTQTGNQILRMVGAFGGPSGGDPTSSQFDAGCTIKGEVGRTWTAVIALTICSVKSELVRTTAGSLFC